MKIPLPAIILVVFFALFFFIRNKTTYGRRVYATGSNAVCAKLVGVNTAKIKMSVYAISGFLAALAGTSMSGSRGKITGTIAGVLIIAVLNNALSLLGVTSYYDTPVHLEPGCLVIWMQRRGCF